MISKETVEAVRNTSDIVSTIAEYTKLERRGGNDWWGCCPFHNEKSPSFHVDGDKKFYYCFGCHASGDVIRFVMETEKLRYSDAVVSLARKAGIPVRYQDGGERAQSPEDSLADRYTELYERTAAMFHYILLERPEGKAALEYIRSRGITMETIEKFKLGYSPADRRWLRRFLEGKNFSGEFLDGSGLFSRRYHEISFFSDRLMFPIFNRRGQTVAFGGRIIHPQGPDDRKYMNSGDLPQYSKRSTLYAFNFAKNAVRAEKRIIFCEGYMDCIAYHQCGIEYAVAPLGTALTEEQVSMIRGFADTVLLSFDSDGAGQAATLKAILMCRRNGLTVRVIRLTGGKDPAEIMLKFGADNLTRQVNNAILDSDYLLNTLGEKYPTDTPEGKTRAALDFFPYIDSLQSDILKESCLEQLGQTFNLKPEAVKRDFLNREQARIRAGTPRNKIPEKNTTTRQSAELRGLLAVTADLSQFARLRSEIGRDDFRTDKARELFGILEECYEAGCLTIPDILARCGENGLSQLITYAVSSEVYQKENTAAVIDDTVRYIKRNVIDGRRTALLRRIQSYAVTTEDDQKQLNSLLLEKMQLDKQAQSLAK